MVMQLPHERTKTFTTKLDHHNIMMIERYMEITSNNIEVRLIKR